jgi:hypothetical protein
LERQLGDGGRDFTGEFHVEMARDLELAVLMANATTRLGVIPSRAAVTAS